MTSVGLRLILAGLILFFSGVANAQPPTGTGDSSKPRPRDISPLAVKRVLAKARLASAAAKSVRSTRAEAEETIQPYKTPDLSGTTWSLTGEDGGKKWAEIMNF